MITLTNPQVTSVTIDTVRLAYIELSFENASARAILSYGTTDRDGNFVEVRRVTTNIDPLVVDMAQALSSARDAFEALLLEVPTPVDPKQAPVAIIADAATQASEATVGKLIVPDSAVQKVV